MNYFCRLRKLVVFALVFLFIPNIYAYANGGPGDTSPVAMTGNIRLIQKENITIESEDLSIKIDGDDLNVKVVYDLMNNGKEDTFTYVFPVDYLKDDHAENFPETLSDFSIWDGDKKLTIKEELIEEKNIDEQKDFSGYKDIYIDKVLRKWFVTKMKFMPNEKKRITVQYKVKSSYCDWGYSNQFFSIYDKNFFIYDLTPASNFGDGVIKNFNVTIDATKLEKSDGKIEKMNLKNCKYNKGIYEFKAKDFKINSQKNILLNYNHIENKEKKEMMDTRIDRKHIKRIVASSTLKNYSLENLLDGKLDTAWVEGVKGIGAYQWIKIEFDRPIRLGCIGIINGYTKSDDTYKNNGKVKKVRVERFCNNLLIGESVIELKEKNFKELDKKYYNKSVESIGTYGYGYEKVDKLRITLLDAYKGSKYDDTCISELFLLSHDDFKDETLLKLYNKKEKSSEDISRILELLPYVNGDDFYEISQIGFEDVIGWIDTLDLKKDNDYINVLKLSHNVDGASSEMYSGIIKNLFLKDPARFIKMFSKVPMYMESISNLLAYELQFDESVDKVYENIDNLLKSSILSKEEKKTARFFVKSFREAIRIDGYEG